MAPHGQEELRYLMNKTESYRLHLETLVTVRKGYVDFDEAFRLWKAGKSTARNWCAGLDASMALFGEATANGTANNGEVCRGD